MSRAHGGLGLGLALVRQLVEMQGGEVTASSPGAGMGAVFRITFPAGAAPILQPGPKAPAARDRLDNVRVMVVDDDQDARDLTAAALSEVGAHVIVVASSEQALSLLRGAESDGPQLLIADLGMPGTDGFELIAAVRQLPGKAAKVCAIALTAYARDQDRSRAISSGFDRHLAKPVTPAVLVKTVLEVLGRSG